MAIVHNHSNNTNKKIWDFSYLYKMFVVTVPAITYACLFTFMIWRIYRQRHVFRYVLKLLISFLLFYLKLSVPLGFFPFHSNWGEFIIVSINCVRINYVYRVIHVSIRVIVWWLMSLTSSGIFKNYVNASWTFCY